MVWAGAHEVLWVIQHSISFLGMLVILSGILFAIYQYIRYLLVGAPTVNAIRLGLGRVLILGLEFIVAADLIGTTTTPDYYSVGILAAIVIIRTLLSYSLSREMMVLSKEDAPQ